MGDRPRRNPGDGWGRSVNVRGGGAIGWLGCWVRLDETVKHHS